MKKITLSLIVALATIGHAEAQEKNYNRWSIDVNGGLTKPVRKMTSGYSTNTFNSLYHFDIGGRYMLNTKFGVKADFGYDSMKEGKNSPKFKTNYYRFDLQGVVNLGRVLNFEDWTNTISLQGHAGFGYSWMTSDNFKGTDNMGNVITGLTGQVKLSEKVALNADFTMINNIRQNRTFDGNTEIHSRGVQGTMFNATIGFSFYLGDHAQHADWYVEQTDKNVLEEISNKLTAIETGLIDSDGDGIPDYLDAEPNSAPGSIVNMKGVNIDLDGNGIPDSYEEQFVQYYKNNAPASMNNTDSNVAKQLINDGYISMYFDFNKSQPKNTDALSFVLNYLKANPSATVEVNGYADSVGSSKYNTTLSDKRANSVAKMLEESGIAKSRIKVVGKGIDNSLNGKNKVASQFARKVTFKVN